MLTNKKLSGGVVHKMPADFNKALLANAKIAATWENIITPLGRNEWICWIEDAKKDETRRKRIQVGISKLSHGERRPCCWVGCIHRPDKAMSPSVKWALGKRSKK